MGSLLVDLWLGDAEPFEIRDEASVSSVRERIRDLGRERAMPRDAIESLATCASELGWNQIKHGRRPQVIGLEALEREGVPGLEVIAADAGPGIARPGDAFTGTGGASKDGLGIGLAGVRRLADELDVDVRLGEGTCVRARKLAKPARRRREVAVYGRPCQGFRVSGDAAAVCRDDRRLLLAVADGLGHGEEAQAGSLSALREACRAPGTPLGVLVGGIASAVRSTRGCVLALARVDEGAGALDHAIVGDVRGMAARPGSARVFRAARGFLGPGAPRVRLVEERIELDDDEIVCLCTDGVSRSLDLGDQRDLLPRAPIAIAEAIAARYGKDHDDALVLVAKSIAARQKGP